MALVLVREDGTGRPDANSYADVAGDADLIHYTLGASEKEEEGAIRKAVDFCTTARLTRP
jgi:hypothetical protein